VGEGRGPRHGSGSLTEEPGGRGSDIGLSHQALADEIGAYAGAAETRDVGVGEDAALADKHTIRRDERRQMLGDGE
jgi:hypothetical protein